MTELQRVIEDLEARGRCTLVNVEAWDATSRTMCHTVGSAVPEVISWPTCIEYTITVRVYKK
jgi:hypothetical protein